MNVLPQWVPCFGFSSECNLLQIPSKLNLFLSNDTKMSVLCQVIRCVLHKDSIDEEDLLNSFIQKCK